MSCVEAKVVVFGGRGVGAVGEEEWARAMAGQVDELRGDARGVFSDGAFSAMVASVRRRGGVESPHGVYGIVWGPNLWMVPLKTRTQIRERVSVAIKHTRLC